MLLEMSLKGHSCNWVTDVSIKCLNLGYLYINGLARISIAITDNSPPKRAEHTQKDIWISACISKTVNILLYFIPLKFIGQITYILSDFWKGFILINVQIQAVEQTHVHNNVIQISLQNFYSTIYILCMIQNIWWPLKMITFYILIFLENQIIK